MICNLTQNPLLFNQTVWRILLSSTFFIIRNSLRTRFYNKHCHSLTSKIDGNRFLQEFLKNYKKKFRNSGSLCSVWLTEWVLGDGCIVTRFLQCTWKLQRTPRRTRRRRHTVRRTAPRVFFCSILAWYHWWEFFSVKFGNFTPHRKNKQKVAWRKSTALPTERRPLFFLRKPQQQIVWTKHTAALTRRGIHKWLSYTGVPLVLDSTKRKALSISIWRRLHVSVEDM